MAAAVDVVIIGAGLAGLTAAATCSAAGLACTVVDARSAVGGRARTDDHGGFLFNQGPHALYTAGPGTAALRELGIEPSGEQPRLAGGLAIQNGTLHPFPFDPSTIASTAVLPDPSKADFGAFMGAVGSLDASMLARQTLADWLADAFQTPEARAVGSALVRLASYANDPDHMSAEVAVVQLQTAFGGPLLYLHGGWQTLVDQLVAIVTKNHGVTITGTVTGIEANGGLHTVVIAGDTIDSRAVIVATGNAASARQLLSNGAGQRWRIGTPARLACLDVGLRQLPIPKNCFALGIDEPTYMSVHCPDARLAPDGEVVLHVARYLEPGETAEPARQRGTLEAVLDLVQPGWRDVSRAVRYLHQMVVTSATPSAADGGLGGRPTTTDTGVDGVYVAGDWVGPVGMLSDASIASGREAARAAIRHVATRS